MSVQSQKSRAFNVSLLIALHLLIVLPLAYTVNIWMDEGSTLHTTQHGFFDAFQNAGASERQAPLYFWVMSLWRMVNGSIFFARLFSIICSAAAIKVFADLARRLFAPRAALLATAFFALHPFLIWASVEIRVYSLVILLTVLILKQFFSAFDDDPEAQTQSSQRNARIWFLLTAIDALYTNYYLGFVLAGCFAALLVRQKWAEARRYFLLMIAAGIAFLPMVFAVNAQFAGNTGGYHEERSFMVGIRQLWHHFLTFVLPAEVFPDEDLSLADIIRAWTVRAILVIVGIFTIKNRKNISERTVSLGVVTAVIFACMLAAYFVVGPQFVEVRHVSVLFVPLILLAASLLSDIFGGIEERLAGKLAMAAAGVIVLVSFSYALVTLYPNMAKRGDWARVGEYIRQNEAPGQPIIIFQTFDAMSLPYHYSGVNKVLPDERFMDFEVEAAAGTADSLKRQTDFTISKIPPDAAEIWLVENDKCRVTEACVPLENYVQANYTVIQEQEFYRENVRLLRKKTQ